jgi:hypothetical protein
MNTKKALTLAPVKFGEVVADLLKVSPNEGNSEAPDAKKEAKKPARKRLKKVGLGLSKTQFREVPRPCPAPEYLSRAKSHRPRRASGAGLR